MKIKRLLLSIIILFATISYAQDWTLYQKTSIKGAINGSINKGYLFKTSEREFFEITEKTRLRVRERNPDVSIYKSGSDYRLEIEGFDAPVICRKIEDVIESTIYGAFKGWDGAIIFKLTNGQIWQQAEYAYMYHYAYRPSVTIYESKDGIKLKVEDVEEIITVKKLK